MLIFLKKKLSICCKNKFGTASTVLHLKKNSFHFVFLGRENQRAAITVAVLAVGLAVKCPCTGLLGQGLLCPRQAFHIEYVSQD